MPGPVAGEVDGAAASVGPAIKSLINTNLINIIPFYSDNSKLTQPEEEKKYITDFYDIIGFNTKELNTNIDADHAEVISNNIIKYSLELNLSTYT